MLISSTLPQTVGTKVKERSLNEPALFLVQQLQARFFVKKGTPPKKKNMGDAPSGELSGKYWENNETQISQPGIGRFHAWEV